MEVFRKTVVAAIVSVINIPNCPHFSSTPVKSPVIRAQIILAGFFYDIRYKIVVMKNTIKKMLGIIVLLGTASFLLPGCIEHRYVNEHHHHSPEYYHRHHRTPPPGVDIDIHN